MNATAPRFGAEQRVLGLTAMTPPAPVPAPGERTTRRQRGRAWLPGAWSRPRWLLPVLVAAGLTTLVIGWAVVGGSNGVQPVGVRDNHQVAANGVVEGASRERPLAAEVAGTLKAVHVQVNQDVPAGALDRKSVV